MALPTELPRRGVVEFVRLVRSDRIVRILGVKVTVPEAFVHRYLTARLYLRTRTLVIDGAGSGKAIPFRSAIEDGTMSCWLVWLDFRNDVLLCVN